MSNEKPSPKVEPPDAKPAELPPEKGGYKDKGLPEPTRYNDWEVGGRCTDF
jgi:hypothetical protein